MVKLSSFINNLKFKQKLFLSYLLVLIIPLIVLGAYSFEQSKKLLLQQARYDLEDNVDQVVDNINNKITQYNTVIESISYNSSITQIFQNDYSNYYYMYNDYTEKIDPLFNTLMFIHNDIKRITVYTENNLTERRNTILSLNRIKDKNWYKEAIKNGDTQWFFIDEKVFGTRRIVGNFPNAYDNVVYLELNHSNMFDGLGIDLWKEFGILISDNNGKVIYSNENLISNEFFINPKYIQAYNKENIQLKDENIIVINKEIQAPGWNLIFYKPLNSIVIDSSRIITTTVIVSAICLLTLTLIVWLLSVKFVKRIYILNNKMKLVAERNLNIEINSKSKDEIGELTNRFGSMLKSIKTLIDELVESKHVQKEAEMKALQAQINPHFLYNSLSLINWKAITIDAEDISHITTTLSKFYRTTLNNGKNIISIKEELENTKAYLEIQSIMHDYSFEVDFNIDDSLYQFDMIKLILQPIVENAIEHGIDQKRDGKGILSVTGVQTGKRIEFLIEDNGNGMDDSLIEEVLVKHSKGYGLYNVNQRIKTFFGEEYGLSINSIKGKGTQISVVIPKYVRKAM
jgi:two-component system, sensor histidine kinase YesM